MDVGKGEEGVEEEEDQTALKLQKDFLRMAAGYVRRCYLDGSSFHLQINIR